VPDSDTPDFADALPEYVAECDEHLTAARRVLLEIEPSPDRTTRGQIDELFRIFHSIKGLSGIVGVRDAERLAHHLEGYLGAVRKGHASLTSSGIGVLIEGVQTLEGVIAASRDRLPTPDVAPLIARAEGLLPNRPQPPAASTPVVGPGPQASGVAGRPPGKEIAIAAALEHGARAWRVTFTPSPALAEKGVSVNAVRERLQAAGEIVHAEPIVLPGKGVKFSFLVLSRADEFAAQFRDDWLAVESYHPATQPAADKAPEPAHTVTALTPTNLVRVDLGRLDDLMRTVGELVVSRARLDNGLGRVAAALPAPEWRELHETSLTIERQLRNLREGVMRVRLVPVRDVFARMRLVVRDLGREAGKEIDLTLTGEETEVDKFVVERLADPLLHLVRNAVSHGLEPPGERAAAGKRPRGRIDLRAAAAGGAIVIEVEDDGRGIDPEWVFARARAVGLVVPDAPSDPAAVLDLICSPGFSTRETADRSSGRGVGMDVVRRAVDELGGTLILSTRPGLGTRFTARLPLTLAIADALIVTVGNQTYAVPQAAVREVVQVEPGEPTALENNELLRHRGSVLPLVRLTDVFGTGRPTGAFPALVIGEGGNAVALAADRVLGLREIVVRPLADPLVQVPGVAGATELGDGRAVLILDTAGLAHRGRTRRPSG
jgi:two-component system chemotaxis sensor kinase CheA